MNDSNEDEENYYYTSGFESEYTETDPSSKNYETPIENPNSIYIYIYIYE